MASSALVQRSMVDLQLSILGQSGHTVSVVGVHAVGVAVPDSVLLVAALDAVGALDVLASLHDGAGVASLRDVLLALLARRAVVELGVRGDRARVGDELALLRLGARLAHSIVGDRVDGLHELARDVGVGALVADSALGALRVRGVRAGLREEEAILALRARRALGVALLRALHGLVEASSTDLARHAAQTLHGLQSWSQ